MNFLSIARPDAALATTSNAATVPSSVAIARRDGDDAPPRVVAIAVHRNPDASPPLATVSRQDILGSYSFTPSPVPLAAHRALRQRHDAARIQSSREERSNWDIRNELSLDGPGQILSNLYGGVFRGPVD